MRGIKHFTLRFSLVTSILLLSMNSISVAKSVYAITDHGYRQVGSSHAKISAYRIDSDQINWQETLTLDPNYYPTGRYLGPVGLAIDSESEYMFVTHESLAGYGGLEGIQLINAKTMVDEGVIEVQGAPDLAGIVFDNERRKVYAVERGTNKLFVLLWDAQNKTLTLEGGEPKTLTGIDNYACDISPSLPPIFIQLLEKLLFIRPHLFEKSASFSGSSQMQCRWSSGRVYIRFPSRLAPAPVAWAIFIPPARYVRL